MHSFQIYSIIVTLSIQLVTFIWWLGRLSVRVDVLERDVVNMCKRSAEVIGRIDKVIEKLARIDMDTTYTKEKINKLEKTIENMRQL